MMLYNDMANEIKSLEEVTNKSMSQLVNYYHKCYQKIHHNGEYTTTEFEFNEFEGKVNDMILSFLRDYALHDIDDSNLLKNYKANDDDLFNCCSPYRLG